MHLYLCFHRILFVFHWIAKQLLNLSCLNHSEYLVLSYHLIWLWFHHIFRLTSFSQLGNYVKQLTLIEQHHHTLSLYMHSIKCSITKSRIPSNAKLCVHCFGNGTATNTLNSCEIIIQNDRMSGGDEFHI